MTGANAGHCNRLQYGGGYQTGTLAVGDSALMITKTAPTAELAAEISVGLLSLRFMDVLALSEVCAVGTRLCAAS